MVSRVIIIAAGLAAAGIAAAAEIDFHPLAQKTAFEGAPFQQTAFRNGDGLVIYNPPAGWGVEGEGRVLTLRPPAGYASARVESRGLPGNTALDEGCLATLRAEILRSLPGEAREAVWEPVEENPVLLNRHETRRLTVTYTQLNQRFSTTVVVCNFAAQQIRFRLDCRQADFEKLYEGMRRSLYSWQGMP